MRLEEWQKWQLQANARIDQLKSDLEANIQGVAKMVKGTSDPIASELGCLFLLQVFSERLEQNEPLRDGTSIEDFKNFLKGV
jgi:hypothetical protein